ncbi:YidH family protein [Methylobacter sp.]|uniref:YidH family protein n=1 Tax=Methylobacter sp. TaxID=2051955 RepID=UPI002FDD213F
MAISDSDPRVFFAAERTLLAWLRTGLTIIAIGFVVARFGLFVRLLSLQTQPYQHSTSSLLSAGLGIAFVVVGSLAIFVAAVQHARFIATLTLTDLPPAYSRKIAVILSLMVGSLGIALSGYLLFTSN